jgi:hypothetical protein
MTSVMVMSSSVVILDHVLDCIRKQRASYTTTNRTQSPMTRVFAKMMA